jgi:hypothetical protein
MLRKSDGFEIVGSELIKFMNSLMPKIEVNHNLPTGLSLALLNVQFTNMCMVAFIVFDVTPR